MKRFYELTFIVNSSLDDATIEGTVKSVQEQITKNNGHIVTVDHLGRRRLAYPIAKKHNGYYASIEFETEAESVDRVERALQLDENILRHLTLKLDQRELEAKRNRAAALAGITSETEGTEEIVANDTGGE